MHELSVAQSILEIAEAAARRESSRRIQSIRIRLGEFTTLVPEALEFAFEVARRGTLADEATLQIELVPMVTRCVACGETENPARHVRLLCPRCGLPLEIASGEELQVESIEVESGAGAERNEWTA